MKSVLAEEKTVFSNCRHCQSQQTKGNMSSSPDLFPLQGTYSFLVVKNTQLGEQVHLGV